MAHRPRFLAVVHAESRMIWAPSPRAAIMPVSEFISPGPVVVNTAAGAPVAKCASVAAKTAPDSCRQCITFMLLADRAPQMAAIAPPETPKAWRTPNADNRSTMASLAFGCATVAGRGASVVALLVAITVLFRGWFARRSADASPGSLSNQNSAPFVRLVVPFIQHGKMREDEIEPVSSDAGSQRARQLTQPHTFRVGEQNAYCVFSNAPSTYGTWTKASSSMSNSWGSVLWRMLASNSGDGWAIAPPDGNTDSGAGGAQARLRQLQVHRAADPGGLHRQGRLCNLSTAGQQGRALFSIRRSLNYGAELSPYFATPTGTFLT